MEDSSGLQLGMAPCDDQPCGVVACNATAVIGRRMGCSQYLQLFACRTVLTGKSQQDVGSQLRLLLGKCKTLCYPLAVSLSALSIDSSRSTSPASFLTVRWVILLLVVYASDGT